MQYYYMITLQWVVGGGRGSAVRTSDGVVDVRPSETRIQVTGRVFAEAKKAAGLPGDATVLFFTLEPNDLGT